MGLKPDQIFQKVCFMNWMNGVWKTEKKVFKKHNQYYIWPFVHFKKNVFVNGFDGVLLLQEKKNLLGIFSSLISMTRFTMTVSYWEKWLHEGRGDIQINQLLTWIIQTLQTYLKK